MKDVGFHEQAEQELKSAAEYYEERRKGLGLEFLDEFDRCLMLIRQTPGVYAFHKRTEYRKCLLRRFPYSVSSRKRVIAYG